MRKKKVIPKKVNTVASIKNLSRVSGYSGVRLGVNKSTKKVLSPIPRPKCHFCWPFFKQGFPPQCGHFSTKPPFLPSRGNFLTGAKPKPQNTHSTHYQNLTPKTEPKITTPSEPKIQLQKPNAEGMQYAVVACRTRANRQAISHP